MAEKTHTEPRDDAPVYHLLDWAVMAPSDPGSPPLLKLSVEGGDMCFALANDELKALAIYLYAAQHNIAQLPAPAIH